MGERDRRRPRGPRLLRRRLGRAERRPRAAGALREPRPRPTLLLSAGGVVLLDGVAQRVRVGRRPRRGGPGDPRPAGAAARHAGATTSRTPTTRYWLPNADVRLSGFPRILGPEGTPRLLRTRLGLTHGRAAARRHGRARAQPASPSTTLQGVFFANRNLSAELARDAVVDRVPRARRSRTWRRPARCSRRWDRRADTGSRGAILWRETWTRLAEPRRAVDGPVRPRRPGRHPARPRRRRQRRLLDALTAAVADLRAKGIALDVPLGELQAEPRGSAADRRSPAARRGRAASTSSPPAATRPGRYDPCTGASFVMAAGFDSQGPAARRVVLSYSQSENPRSPHYADQTRLFSRERWLPMRFTEKQIRRDPRLHASGGDAPSGERGRSRRGVALVVTAVGHAAARRRPRRHAVRRHRPGRGVAAAARARRRRPVGDLAPARARAHARETCASRSRSD